jgi:hypothetical protein
VFLGKKPVKCEADGNEWIGRETHQCSPVRAVPPSGVSGTSWFEILAHGIGVYFIGKGIFIGTTTWTQAEANERLDRLVEFEAHRHARDASESG